MKKILVLVAVLSSFMVASLQAREFITLGTGGVTGTYYPTGGAICKMVNQSQKDIRCSVESTGGSVYNINNIKVGELDFGMAQSDMVYLANKGEGAFKGNQYKDLRAVMSIYPELLAFVVSKKSGIKKLSDIKGKRVNIDTPGSGTSATTKIVLKTEGIDIKSAKQVMELRSTEAPTLLKDNKIDGYFAVFGHPTAHIVDSANSLPIGIVPIEGKEIDKIIKKYPYYAKGSISGTFYKGVTKDVTSIGVKAVLVTSAKAKDKAVYTIAKAILDNFNEFKKLHPAYATITKKSLLEGMAVKQHKGAIKAFKEAGLL